MLDEREVTESQDQTVIGNASHSLPKFSDEAFASFCATESGDERRHFLDQLSRDSPEEARWFRRLNETGFLESLDSFDNSIEASRKMRSYAGHLLRRKIAEGGSAMVFEAIQEKTGAVYALKVPHHNDEESRERLQREFEILASVDSAHIPKPVAHSSADEEPFLSMQLIEGRGGKSNRLDDVLEIEDVALETKVRWFKELLSAIGELHSHRYVHRDIKLSNLLVGHDNSIYLIDFGIAVVDCTFKSRLSRNDSLLVACPHVAPELLDGHEPSFAADIYSAGFLLLELLAGKQVHSSNEKLTTLDKSLESFDVVIEKACSKNPAARYQSVSEFSFAIDSAFSSHLHYERMEQLRRSMNLKRLAIIGALAVLALYGILYVIGLELTRRNSLEVYANMEDHLIEQGEFLTELQGALTDTNKDLADTQKKSLQIQEMNLRFGDELAELTMFHESIAGEVGSIREELRVIREQSAKAKGALLSVQDQLEQRQNIEDRVEQLRAKLDEVEEGKSETHKSLLDLKQQLEKMKPRE
ncbi:MAG: hypothetical protein CMJ47_05585 [Planctomyces sp.]|nr:hypothetical protein [Planctomyces sp.]